jgi:anti-sigma regulatory factor (Ser/Thr protein kinase)
MEAFLIDEWLGAADAIAIHDEASVSGARQQARTIAAAQLLSPVDAERLATIASELGHNQLKHARRGQIAVLPVTRGIHRGVEIVAADEGEGIANPTLALEGDAKSAGSLGVGLSSVRRMADEVDIDVRLREGTCVRARVWAPETPRLRQVGAFGRPYRDEPRSGDHACIIREDDRLLIGVCDGLGHGAPARAAAGAAMRVFAQNRSAAPIAIMEECHRTLGPTRGAVMAIVALRERESCTMDLAAVGNITLELVEPRATRRFGATSFVVGSHQRGWRAQVESARVAQDQLFVAFTDGVASRAHISDELVLLRQHPVVIAQYLVEHFGREDDDVLAVVVK